MFMIFWLWKSLSLWAPLLVGVAHQNPPLTTTRPPTKFSSTKSWAAFQKIFKACSLLFGKLLQHGLSLENLVGHAVITAVNVIDVFISSRPWRCLHVYQVFSCMWLSISVLSCWKKVKKKKMNTPTQSKTCLSDSVVLPHLLLVLPGHRGGGGQLWGGHRNLFKSLTSTCRAPPSTSRTPTLSCLGSPLTPSSPSWASCSSSPSSTSSSSSSTSSAAPWSRSGWKKSPNQTLRKSNLCRWWGRAIWSTERVERRARGWRWWRRGRACWTCKLNTEQGLMSEPWQFLLL